MRIFVLPVAAVLLMVSFSCNLMTRQEAMRMNNTLVHINDSLYYMGREYGILLDKATREKDYSMLGPSRMKFEKYIDSCRQSVIGMQDVGGSEALRHCEIDLLGIEKRMVAQDFQGFEHLSPESGMEEVSKLHDVIKEDSKQEVALVNKFRRLQEAYARKNGFVLIRKAIRG